VITPRRIRLLRSTDLAGYRSTLVDLTRNLDSSSAADTFVVVPTSAAREQLARTLVVDASKDQQHRVGAGDLQLQELDLLREEPLREQWDRCRSASCSQVVERAAETLVDEHRDRCGAGVSELQREACRICVRPEVTG
jgi:hypothetical protein